MNTFRVLPLCLMLLVFTACRRDKTPPKGDDTPAPLSGQVAKPKPPDPVVGQPPTKMPVAPQSPSERVADRIVSRLIASGVIHRTVRESGLKNDQIKTHPMRFDGADEALELRLAEAFIRFGPDLKVDDPRFEKRIQEVMLATTDSLKTYALEDAFFASSVKSESESYARIVEFWIKSDELTELAYNAEFTPARADELVRAAKLVQAAMTPEFNAIRAQMRSGMHQAIGDQPAILERYKEYEKASDAVTKSRDQVRGLIRQAAERQSLVASVPPLLEKTKGPRPAPTPPKPTDTAKLPSKTVDKGRLAERAVDYFIAYDLIGILTEDKVAKWARHRFAVLHEPLEEIVGRALVAHFRAEFPGIGLDQPAIQMIVKGRLSQEMRLGKDEKYVLNAYKARRAFLPAENDPRIKTSADQLEKTFNDAVTPGMAKDIVRFAAMVQSATSPEHLEVRNKIKERLREAIGNDADVLKIFEEASQASADVQKSRDRIRELIKQAR